MGAFLPKIYLSQNFGEQFGVPKFYLGARANENLRTTKYLQLLRRYADHLIYRKILSKSKIPNKQTSANYLFSISNAFL